MIKKVKGTTKFEFNRANRPKPKLLVAPKTFPPVPEPKVRSKDRYTVLVLGESGRSRQLDLSRSRLKVLALSGSLILIVAAALAVALPRYFAGSTSKDQTTSQTSTQVDSSMEKTQVANIKDQSSSKQSGTQMPAAVKPILTEPTDSTVRTAGSATPVPESPTGQKPSDHDAMKSSVSASSPPSETPDRQAEQRLTKKAPAGPSETEKSPITPLSADPFVINFDAQQVTAAVDSPNSGTLSFRLVKDQPEIKFAGYLFVYVEMEDQAGENRIYVYPKQTRLGEGDLPFDFRDGESIAFKFNSRVELPYGDPRSAASLAGVSILVYGENGKIVFQRTFGRQEVAMVNTKASKAERAKPRSGEKRQAL
jgi:cytoskeletal protein RodZ